MTTGQRALATGARRARLVAPFLAARASSTHPVICLRYLPGPVATPPSKRPLRSCTATFSSGRSYHSYDHPAPAGPFSEAEKAILAAAYKHVPRHGFSNESLAMGARDAGYLDISTNLLPDGVFTLIQWHLLTQRQALAGRSRALFDAPNETNQVSVLEKVETLTWERLLGNVATVDRLQEALAIMAQPTYVPTSLRELALLVDEIWFLAGDEAVDPTWYTKRASLSAIYATTELFMTTDRSPEYQNTRGFLRRRFQEAGELGGAARSIGEWLGFTATAGMNLLRSKGLRI
ncbi:ubiquinone biosynthesis protein COQ9 [Thozetella sp. PMI_491]|nr:ubiquinone biosynthesis protein COQ9 [Thozetella sp. PMI_491]